MIYLIYNIIVVPLLWIARYILKLSNPRYAVREKIAGEFLSNSTINKFKKERAVWFHVSSMGEFEQAKPVIEQLKELIPDLRIVCSFYSPSGYENQKDYGFADIVTYMPFDSPQNAKKFIEIINPLCAVFVRYDFWMNHLAVLDRLNIPAYLICAAKPGNFKLASKFPLNVFYKKIYTYFKTIWTVGEDQTEFLEFLVKKGDIRTLNDTRLDRIAQQVEIASHNPVISKDIFKPDDFILVIGSSWEEDENLLMSAIKKLNVSLKKNLKLIFVPHVPDEDNVLRVKKLTAPSLTYSEIEPIMKESGIQGLREAVSGRNIVIDRVGLLLRLYHTADAAFVGCGFGNGIHSVSEPSGFGIPTAGGPNILNSPDAMELHRRGSHTIINDEDDLRIWLEKVIDNSVFRESTGRIAKSYVMESLGSSRKVAEEIYAFILAD